MMEAKLLPLCAEGLPCHDTKSLIGIKDAGLDRPLSGSYLLFPLRPLPADFGRKVPMRLLGLFWSRCYGAPEGVFRKFPPQIEVLSPKTA